MASRPCGIGERVVATTVMTAESRALRFDCVKMHETVCTPIGSSPAMATSPLRTIQRMRDAPVAAIDGRPLFQAENMSIDATPYDRLNGLTMGGGAMPIPTA